MSDVIWATMVAVLGSVASGGLAGWITFQVGKRQAEVTEKAVDVPASVELRRSAPSTNGFESNIARTSGACDETRTLGCSTRSKHSISS